MRFRERALTESVCVCIHIYMLHTDTLEELSPSLTCLPSLFLYTLLRRFTYSVGRASEEYVGDLAQEAWRAFSFPPARVYVYIYSIMYVSWLLHTHTERDEGLTNVSRAQARFLTRERFSLYFASLPRLAGRLSAGAAELMMEPFWVLSFGEVVLFFFCSSFCENGLWKYRKNPTFFSFRRLVSARKRVLRDTWTNRCLKWKKNLQKY